MSSMFKWEVVDPAPGQAVGTRQRLSWGRTAGLGAQHVVAMFGATFVFPLVMGLDANLAIMFSGICTILVLLIVQNKVPSYLGTSASFVASVAAIRMLDEGNDVPPVYLAPGAVVEWQIGFKDSRAALLTELQWVDPAASNPEARFATVRVEVSTTRTCSFMRRTAW